MKIPNSVKIGAHRFDVVKLAMESDTCGSTGGTDNRILINQFIPTSQQEETFFHETLHVIDTQLGLELSEQQVQSIAHHIYMVLKENNLLNNNVYSKVD
jgi:hypothetical protein